MASCSHCGVPYEAGMQSCNRKDCPQCFVGSTPVLTQSGWRQISELEKGDAVLSYDFSSMTLEESRILKTKRYCYAQIWEIVGSQRYMPLGATRFHSFRVMRGCRGKWRHTSQLKSGDELLACSESGSTFENTVLSVRKTDKIEPVFNLVTSGQNNFIVPGAIAHNFTYLKSGYGAWHASLDLMERTFSSKSNAAIGTI